jgi:hypothetical protein
MYLMAYTFMYLMDTMEVSDVPSIPFEGHILQISWP